MQQQAYYKWAWWLLLLPLCDAVHAASCWIQLTPSKQNSEMQAWSSKFHAFSIRVNGGGKAMKVCRGVRGATTVEEDTRNAVLSATRDLLNQMVEANGIQRADIASVVFTTTRDLASEYPARAARGLGWLDVALLCAHEMDVPHGPKRCIRILLHWNTEKLPSEIRHIYTKGAASLRPDRVP
jgi:chorismate mutase